MYDTIIKVGGEVMGLFGKKKKRSQRITLEKGEKIVSLGDPRIVYKLLFELSDEHKEMLDNSTLWFERGKKIFMHYHREGLPEDRASREWQEQAIFFWDSDEEFPRKSLPPVFETFRKCYFTFKSADLGDVKIFAATAAPWFDQPGGGTKYSCELENQRLTIDEMLSAGLIEYLNFVQPNEITPKMLKNRERYYFLAADSLDFIDGWPALEGKVLPIHLVYQIGFCTLAERCSFPD
jgi:hypothetical protein